MDNTATRLRDAKLGSAIESAAGKLPKGWQVNIHVMRGGYSVSLLDPLGNDYELDAEDDLVDDINNAVAEAISSDDTQ